MRRALLTVLALLPATSAAAEDGLRAEFVRAYDGDTVTLDVEVPVEFDDQEAVVEFAGQTIAVKSLGHEITLTFRDTEVRLLGVDAPEIKGKCDFEKRHARTARDALAGWLSSASSITLTDVEEEDHYGRPLARVWINGQDAAARLIEQGYARPYDGGARLSWCP